MLSTRRFLRASLAATVVCAPLSTATAQAAFPGTDGRIAFVRNTTTYTMTSAGKEVRAVAANGTKPRWSPDGKRLALLRGGNVWVMNADGTKQSQVTRTGGAGALTWSPDGAWLAAVTTPAAGGNNVLLKVRSTAPYGTPMVVTNRHVDNRSIAWSPDGRSIAFNGGAFEDTYPCADDGLVCISKVDVETGVIDVLTYTGGSVHSQDDMFAPDWKPDSSSILFSLKQTARDYSGDSTPLHVNLLQPSKTYTTSGGVYSPSGARIAFTKRTGTRNEIYTAAADGTGWQRLAAGRDADWQPSR